MTQYSELAEKLREQIKTGCLKPGDRLPSFAELRRQFGFNQTTVEKAQALLEKEGLIERQRRRGIFVCEPPRKAMTGLIGFIGTAYERREFSIYDARLVEGVQMAAQAHQRHILMLAGNAFWNDVEVSLVDGILLQNPHPSFLKRLPPDLPCVAMLGGEEMSCVVADDYGGAKSAVRHLAELGHRRIGILMSKSIPVTQSRYAGYLSGLHEAGIEFDPRWEWQPPSDCVPGQEYVGWGRENMWAWLNNGWSQAGCTAILAQNDLVAAGVMQVLQETGMRVPEQVSVIGFDGTEFCDCLQPRLTSVAVPLREIGARAVDVLLKIIQEGGTQGRPHETVTLSTHIKSGASTVPPETAAK